MGSVGVGEGFNQLRSEDQLLKYDQLSRLALCPQPQDADSSDTEMASLRESLCSLTVSSEISDPSSSRQEVLAAIGKVGNSSSECSTSGRSEDADDHYVEPLLRENADRFTMHPIR